MSLIPSPLANPAHSRRSVVVDPAITIWLLAAAGAAWQIGGSLTMRGLFVAILAVSAVGLAFAGSWNRQ